MSSRFAVTRPVPPLARPPSVVAGFPGVAGIVAITWQRTTLAASLEPGALPGVPRVFRAERSAVLHRPVAPSASSVPETRAALRIHPARIRRRMPEEGGRMPWSLSKRSLTS